MPAFLRLIRLALVAKLRSAGWAPWLLVAGWLLMASYQEPLLFRGYGIYLVDDAAWSGCLALLIVLLLSERRIPNRWPVLTSISLLCLVSLLQTGLAHLADQSSQAAGMGARIIGAIYFFLAWSPLAITLGSNIGVGGRSRLLHMMVVLAAGLMGSMLAVALRTSPDTFVYLASVLAFAGATCWASGRPTNT
jgi:hypothetical protein